ncbi:MAG: histidine phosphatase family protein [Cellulosilyticaceae bacterium]
MKVYWLRHGETIENQKGTYYGYLDAMLTKQGRLSIQKYQGFWQQPLAVYSSPRKRAIETAQIIGYDAPILDERLAERHMGIWEGMTYSEIKQQNPQELMDWHSQWQDYCIPEGESARMQYERVRLFVNMLEQQGEDALVVSHGGTMQMALAYMMFDQIEAFWKFKTTPGGLVVTSCDDGYWYVEEMTP